MRRAWRIACSACPIRLPSRRPFDEAFKEELGKLTIPTLIMTGDENDPALEPSIFLKRAISSAELAIMLGTGHTLHLEEPAEFNRLLDGFLHQVASGRWRQRDPRALGGGMLGV
ncbi:MAG: hypothetical protein EXR33_11410 [Betaproteobacteria bacterium]|nr:hypothetical protein [Betaproteobacteria bacterium]